MLKYVQDRSPSAVPPRPLRALKPGIPDDCKQIRCKFAKVQANPTLAWADKAAEPPSLKADLGSKRRREEDRLRAEGRDGRTERPPGDAFPTSGPLPGCPLLSPGAQTPIPVCRRTGAGFPIRPAHPRTLPAR